MNIVVQIPFELMFVPVISPGVGLLVEKGMAAHSSVLAWRIPWTEEPGGLQSMGSRREGHDWSEWAQHRIAGSNGNSSFSSSRTLHTVFYRGRASVHAHPKCRGLPFPQCFPTFVPFVNFLTTVILWDWYEVVSHHSLDFLLAFISTT